MARTLSLGVACSIAIGMFIGPPPVSAQTVGSTTGAINGKATDNTSAVLPGVTVSIASPSMMGSRTMATSVDGTYRFAAVPPGDYTVTFELTGFGKVIREGIRVGVGFTASVNAEMQVAALNENVTVTGASPVVDTQSTAITTNFDAARLASLPSARDMWAILAESPAVSLSRIDVGGSAAGTQTGYFAYGTQDQNRPMVEGIVATEGTGAAGFYYDYGSFEDVNVETAAHSAEMPWPGVQSQFIAKSGGNQYHGSWYSDYENKSWQSVNVDSDQIARGLQGGPGLPPEQTNRTTSYRDINTDLGGYLTKDKLWWYGSFRNQDVAAQYANFPVKPHVTDLLNFSGKGTYQLSTNNKLVGFGTANRKHQPTRLDSFLLGNTTDINTSPVSTWEQLYWAWVWKGEWTSVLSDKVFLELRGGQFGYNWPNHSNGSQLRYEDIGNNYVYGSNREWDRDRRRNQVIGSFSYFKDGLAGTHNFKFGGEVFRETVVDDYIDGYPGDMVHVLNNGAPSQIYLIEAPSVSQNGLWTYSAYANDIWKLTNRLTLNVGVRFDRYRAFLPAQVHPVGIWNKTEIDFPANDDVIHWNLPSPRLGATYDIGGNGKTVVKFNYGQYWWNPGADFLLTNVNPNPNVWWKQFVWSDLNGDGRYEPGEEGRLIATKGGPTEHLDPDLQDTYTKEAAAWIERELMTNFGIRTGFVWRGQRQRYQRVNVSQPFSAFNVPVLVADPGPDGRYGTADDGTPIQAYDLDAAHLALSPNNVTQNVAANDDYYTWEITANKRMSNRWSLLATYAWIKSYDNSNSYFGQTVRTNNLPSTPNDDINTVDGRYVFTTWTSKLHGTYEAPRGIRITPILRIQAGQPFGRTFVVPSGTLKYANPRILAEPLDARRQDNLVIFDLRAEKVFALTSALKVSGFLDLFNLFNSNAEQNISYSSGASFLRPLNIIPPRIARIGAKFTF
jgi:carboxypeptidase family protein/TonB-dependent receptor-like protein